MLIAETRDARTLYLVKDGNTSNEDFARNWQGLIRTNAYMQAAQSSQDDMTEPLRY